MTVRDTIEVYHKHKIATEVLAAGLRHPLHCAAAAGLARFTQDWGSASTG